MPLPEPQIDEETEIKFEMEREKQAKLLERQKMLNQKLMLAQGKQKSLTKKLYKYKQLLVSEGFSDLVESTRINRIQINEAGEVFDFDAKYGRFNEDGPSYSSKFVKKPRPQEKALGPAKETSQRQEKFPRKAAKKSAKKRRGEGEQSGYLKQYKSKKMLGETGNQLKKPKKASTLRNTTKSAKDLRATPQRPAKKVTQSHLEPKGKPKGRRKSTVGRGKKQLTKNRSTRSHRAAASKSKGKSLQQARKKAARRKSDLKMGVETQASHGAPVTSGFQKVDKLQAKRLERRQRSQRSSECDQSTAGWTRSSGAKWTTSLPGTGR